MTTLDLFSAPVMAARIAAPSAHAWHAGAGQRARDVWEGRWCAAVWVALLPSNSAEGAESADEAEALQAGPEAVLERVALWCLQFTPRVARLDGAVVMEVAGSLRLFQGRRRLAERIRDEGPALGVAAHAWAPTSLGAIALARQGVLDAWAHGWPSVLDDLPLSALDAVHTHAAILSRLGCQTLGAVRALPRAGLTRRFAPTLLQALDQAYGASPSVHTWVVAPERFVQTLELMTRVEHAPALLHGAARLLRQLSVWLMARGLGATALTLRWRHDVLRAREVGPGDELVVRTGEPTQQVAHWQRLLSEHLAKIRLQAPVAELVLEALAVQPYQPVSQGLLLGASSAGAAGASGGGEPWLWTLERLAARLGAHRVLRPSLRPDHRLAWQVRWSPVTAAPHDLVGLAQHDGHRPQNVQQVFGGQVIDRADFTAEESPRMPQPTFLLPELACPSKLSCVSGPHRIDAGWWHRDADADGAECVHAVTRDYWIARTRQSHLLWIFQAREPQAAGRWFLQGVFA